MELSLLHLQRNQFAASALECSWEEEITLIGEVVTGAKVAFYNYLKGASSEVGVSLLPGNNCKSQSENPSFLPHDCQRLRPPLDPGPQHRRDPSFSLQLHPLDQDALLRDPCRNNGHCHGFLAVFAEAVFALTDCAVPAAEPRPAIPTKPTPLPGILPLALKRTITTPPEEQAFEASPADDGSIDLRATETAKVVCWHRRHEDPRLSVGLSVQQPVVLRGPSPYATPPPDGVAEGASFGAVKNLTMNLDGNPDKPASVTGTAPPFCPKQSHISAEIVPDWAKREKIKWASHTCYGWEANKCSKITAFCPAVPSINTPWIIPSY
ncbi:uncharacterized protein LOC134547620 [Prinia subflava]|uniref:uncharacterized protein LOC134547620 n=1 Tax=Prinia subflava TaxID=208062 RepID=UPI002FE10D21